MNMLSAKIMKYYITHLEVENYKKRRDKQENPNMLNKSINRV